MFARIANMKFLQIFAMSIYAIFFLTYDPI